MEPDVTSTLTELERKLKELERELESVGRGGEPDTDPAQAGWTHQAEAEPEQPAPPPPGTTPFTAVWHGQAEPPPQQAPQVVEWRAYSSPAPPPPQQQQELDDLVRFRERLVGAANSLVTELSRVLEELGAAQPPAAPPAEPLLDGRIVVEAAPFGSVATLGAFEQALAQTPGVVEAQVRTLESGRATIDVHLERPTALTGELARTTPVGFRVVHAGDGRLVLEVDAGG
jgi:hypothetical protein